MLPTQPTAARPAPRPTARSTAEDATPTPPLGTRAVTQTEPGPDDAPATLDVRGVPTAIGRYRIVGRIATGGMADILLGKLSGPSGFERAVVVKSILPHLARDEGFVNMFLDEARLTAQIRHPNVVQVHELGRDGALLFLVMEYLDGESCNTLLREAARRASSLPRTLAAHICAEVAAGLHAAHTLRDEQGRPRSVVHRDVSPHNILVTYSGHVKLLDFGIAKATGRVAEGTQAGQVKGKFAYMAPEQALHGDLDARSDVFSLGIVLWEMTTGRRLFKRATELAVLRALTEEPIAKPTDYLPRYPGLLESIVMRALARDPKDRFQTALDFRQALTAWLRDTNADDTVEEQLAAYMSDRFAARAASKQSLLTRVAADEILDEVEISVVSDPSMGSSAPSFTEVPLEEASVPPPRRRPWPWALALVAVAGVGVALLARGRPPAVVTPAPGVAVPTPTPPAPTPEPPSPTTVGVHVVASPPGATVAIDGAVVGTTPLDVVVPRDKPFSLELSAPGYTSLREQRTPHNDLELQLTLQRVPARPSSRPSAKPAKKPASDPFHRFE